MKDSFIMYRSYVEALMELPDEQRLHLLDAIMAFGLDGKEPALEGVEKALFILIRPQIMANNTRYENGKKGAEYGALGGRPRKNTGEKPQENPEITPKKPQENPTETPNVNVNENVNVNVNENGVYSAPAREDTTGLEKFIERWGINATGMDNYSAGKASGTDWEAVSARVEKSAYLQQQKSLTFYIRHAGEILEGYYDDFVRPPNPPNERNGPRTSIYDAEGLAKMAEYDRIMERNEQRRRQRAQSGGNT